MKKFIVAMLSDDPQNPVSSKRFAFVMGWINFIALIWYMASKLNFELVYALGVLSLALAGVTVFPKVMELIKTPSAPTPATPSASTPLGDLSPIIKEEASTSSADETKNL